MRVRSKKMQYYCMIKNLTTNIVILNKSNRMKKALILIFMSVVFLSMKAQETQSQQPGGSDDQGRASLSVGLLQGGGGLVGADFEALLSNRVGLQLGAGLVSYSLGLNYHLKPGIRSSFLSLSYWHQGVGEGFVQSVFGPSYVFRGRRWFTAQIGLGYVLDRGPAFPDTMQKTPVLLTYSIGAYFVL